MARLAIDWKSSVCGDRQGVCARVCLRECPQRLPARSHLFERRLSIALKLLPQIRVADFGPLEVRKVAFSESVWDLVLRP